MYSSWMDRVPLMDFWNRQSTQPAMTRDLSTDCPFSDVNRFSVLLYFTCTPQRSQNTFVLNTRTEFKGFTCFFFFFKGCRFDHYQWVNHTLQSCSRNLKA